MRKTFKRFIGFVASIVTITLGILAYGLINQPSVHAGATAEVVYRDITFDKNLNAWYDDAIVSDSFKLNVGNYYLTSDLNITKAILPEKKVYILRQLILI